MDARLQRRIQRYGWDRAATAYEAGWQHQLEPAQRRMLELADLQPGDKVLDVAIDRETSRLEGRLLFLATVGSAAPFVGLFGTVWGIMTSFQAIAASKNTALAVVAPGIAEALLATALGLLAAIPAEQAEATSEDPWLETAYVHCRAMRDVGATMGFELLTFAANNLCDIIEIVQSGVDCPFDAIESQLNALLLARKEVARALAAGTRRG